MSYEEPDAQCLLAFKENEADADAEGRVCAPSSNAHRAALPIRYVDEADVESMIRCDELGAQTFMAAELGAAHRPEERARLVRSALRILGFLSFAYVTVSVDPKGRADGAYMLRNGLSTFPVDRMLHTGFFERSTPFHATLKGQAPQLWDLKTLMNAYDWPREFVEQDRRLIDEMREQGLCSGLAFGLPIADTAMRSIVVLASPREVAAEWFTEGILVRSLSLGLSVHQRCAAYLRAAQRRASLGSLSPVHRQILSLLVQGLSDKEIALRLNMTAHNVDYHLRQLKERYGAINRSHLAFIAGRCNRLP
ncbi:autoinducer binding domain-containing protein [Trinickia sp.]|uniref:autoinducer binding domain-containing protein n=1 Tax=Trinickia sp. TaxID=2571163 RepID=UPI003F814DE4